MQPAAVLLYDAQGCAPVFVVDLDSSKAGVDAVESDLAAIEALLETAGLQARFSDRSVSGGRHLYVPLAMPVPHFEARQVAIALEQLHESVDAMPMRGATDGCIRPPGAWHRRGGHQVLDGTLQDAEAALDAPNDPLAWARFVDEVLAKLDAHRTASHEGTDTPDQAGTPATLLALVPPDRRNAPAGTPTPAHQAEDELEDQLEPLRGFNEPDAGYQHIARTGEYDTGRYKTPSDAREAVIWACVASGWAFRDVVRRLHDGTWPGLAGFFARYSDAQRHGAMRRDWRKAVDFEKRRRTARGDSRVRTATTSGRKTQAGGRREGKTHQRPGAHSGVERFVREWLVAVQLIYGPDADLTLRSLLAGMAQMAVLSGTTDIEIGNRGLAVAAATDNGTISRLIQMLLAEPSDRAVIDLVQEARGVRARVITLRIPPLLAPTCAATPWRRGRIHGIRAAFRELGRAAAFVYDVLEQLDEARGGRAIAQKARLSPSATYEALATLAAWGLATNTGNGWRIGKASLARLAECFGVDDKVREQIERYRADRRSWWTWLIEHGHLDPAWVERRTTPPPQPHPPPRIAWDDDTSCVDLLARTLDAQLCVHAG